jgi:hypothetical protein
MLNPIAYLALSSAGAPGRAELPNPAPPIIDGFELCYRSFAFALVVSRSGPEYVWISEIRSDFRIETNAHFVELARFEG